MLRSILRLQEHTHIFTTNNSPKPTATRTLWGCRATAVTESWILSDRQGHREMIMAVIDNKLHKQRDPGPTADLQGMPTAGARAYAVPFCCICTGHAGRRL